MSCSSCAEEQSKFASAALISLCCAEVSFSKAASLVGILSPLFSSAVNGVAVHGCGGAVEALAVGVGVLLGVAFGVAVDVAFLPRGVSSFASWLSPLGLAAAGVLAELVGVAELFGEAELLELLDKADLPEPVESGESSGSEG